MADQLPTANMPVPLVVDVDGTLIKSDLLHEATFQFLAQRPLMVWRIGGWLLRGKAALKRELAGRIDLDTGGIPLREEVVDAIRAAVAEGRPVYLASASDRHWVEAIAARIAGVTGVLASDGQTNLAGRAKASTLIERFGAGGFDYIGDHPVDMPVWSAARRQYLVAHSARFESSVSRRFPAVEIVARPRTVLRGYIRTLRVHQWAKNVLVLLPLIAGHDFAKPAALLAALTAFLAFCFAASSAYILNDLLDLPGDRDHPRKRLRPFASGDVPLARGAMMAPVLMLVAIALALLLPPRFAIVLVTYVVLTLAYSFVLKRQLLMDVIVLGGLYTIRVFGGVTATEEPGSDWLLMFSFFLFLSLATVKRCSELVAREAAGKPAPSGRAYRAGDLGVLFPLAAAAGCGAVLVVALYVTSPQIAALYRHSIRMWLICPLLLYWISRVLILSNRNELHDDPVIFALTDRVSWLVGVAAAAVIAVSI